MRLSYDDPPARGRRTRRSADRTSSFEPGGRRRPPLPAVSTCGRCGVFVFPGEKCVMCAGRGWQPLPGRLA